MVSRLAEDLVMRYAKDATRLLDPFCGSGAVLMAAAAAGIPVAGVDINPVGILLSRTKLEGFDSDTAHSIAEDMIARAIATKAPTSIAWPDKGYWFTPRVVDKT